MGEGATGALGAFTWIDWAVIACFFALTTAIGGRLSGKQATIRDFFLGGRRLPWYAVAGSIVATEISAVTLIGLPSVVFREGGDLTYLQLGLVGSLIARVLIALFLVPAYYQREIYSPYDYMGERLGRGVRGVATALFALGGVLAQASRVYLIAVVLEVILYGELAAIEGATGIPPLVSAVGAIGLVSIAWTLLGGIATVVWTDAILFLVFLAAIAIALVTAVGHLGGGLGEMFAAGREAGKLRLFDFSTDPARAYTFWAALFAVSWGNVAAYGTDQLMAQRLFCCRGVREARKAIVASYAAIGVTVLVGLVGIALYAFYARHHLEGAALELYGAKPEAIFPIFILQMVPVGLKGLILAGAFAAAISSLDSILAALSQTVLSAAWLPLRVRLRRRGADPAAEERRALGVSRALVVLFGLSLCALAVSMEEVARHYPSILDLALAMAGYTQGALLAGFLLAALPLRVDGSGFLWSAPLSVFVVIAIAWPEGWVWGVALAASIAFLAAWILLRLGPALAVGGAPARAELVRTLALLGGLGALLWLAASGFAVAWPWYVPAGCTTALLLGLLLARPRAEARTP